MIWFLGQHYTDAVCKENALKFLCFYRNDTAHYAHCRSKYGPEVFWYKQLPDVPRKFSIYVAHEFFDALPIHKFQVDIFLYFSSDVNFVPDYLFGDLHALCNFSKRAANARVLLNSFS